MIKKATNIEGLYQVRLSQFSDERGESIKIFSTEEFESLGLPTSWTQTLRVANRRRGTLRGMHWQAEPNCETKLVHCERGRIFDAVVDVRTGSDTFGRWCGFELEGGVPEALLVPAGLAHGYLTLEDDTELLYQIGGDYHENLQRVFRWDDSTVGIGWPEHPVIVSTRDSDAPLWTDIFP